MFQGLWGERKVETASLLALGEQRVEAALAQILPGICIRYWWRFRMSKSYQVKAVRRLNMSERLDKLNMQTA